MVSHFKQYLNRKTYSALFGLGLFIPFILSSSFAQERPDNDIAQRGDPARWYQESNTPEAYFATLKKEVYAVYQESLNSCKHARGSQNECTKEAKLQLQRDLVDAKNIAQTR